MNLHRILKSFLVPALLLGSATVLAQNAAPAPAAATASTQRYTANFRDVDIAVLAETVAQATGKTFILDPRVRANVNLISSIANDGQ